MISIAGDGDRNYQHSPSGIQLANYFSGYWGGGVLAQMTERKIQALIEAENSDLNAILDLPKVEEFEFPWDYIGKAFHGRGEETEFRFIYHFPGKDDLDKEQRIIKWWFTESPYQLSRYEKLSETVVLQHIESQGSTVIAEFTTDHKSLMITVFEKRGFYTFIPSFPIDENTFIK